MEGQRAQGTRLALPCDPPEGDSGKEGGAGFRAGILVERTHGVGGNRKWSVKLLIYAGAWQQAGEQSGLTLQRTRSHPHTDDSHP